MAHTKAQKAVKGNRDSAGRRLGIKIYGGEKIGVGSIILRQRGLKVHPGVGTEASRDHTIFALKIGKVEFVTKQGKQYVVVK